MLHSSLEVRNKKVLVPNNLGNKDRIDILRYHLVCRRSDHLMQMPTHPLPHNAGIASEDTRLAPFPLPSAAHLPVRLPPCSQLCRTLCGCASDFTSASTVSKLTCGHYTPPPSVCQALFFTADGQIEIARGFAAAGGGNRDYLANSTALVSRMTLTLIWPGYSSSDSIFLATSRASRIILSSLTSSGLTMMRTSRPAWMA